MGFTAHVKPRGEEAVEKAATSGYRARRWVVERTHSWMNRLRRLLICWEKKAGKFEVLLHFACDDYLARRRLDEIGSKEQDARS